MLDILYFNLHIHCGNVIFIPTWLSKIFVKDFIMIIYIGVYELILKMLLM